MRGRYPAGARWWAVMSHFGREKRVLDWIRENLSGQSFDEAFLPLVRSEHKSPERVSDSSPRLLFNSYLFLRCEMNDDIYTAVCDHPHVYQILGRAYRIPSFLDEDEIHHLKQILESDREVEMVTRASIGDSVEIVRGAMAGVRGHVRAVNSRRVRLEIPFSFLDMGTSVAVSVPRRDVKIMKDCDSTQSTREMVCHAQV